MGVFFHLRLAPLGDRQRTPEAKQPDLVGPGYKYGSDGALVLESKEEMRKRGVRMKTTRLRCASTRITDFKMTPVRRR